MTKLPSRARRTNESTERAESSTVEPLEAALLEVLVVQRRYVPVQAAEIAIQPLHAGVGLEPELGPRELAALAPLRPLRELVAHERELLARVGHLPRGEQPQVGELLPGVAGHLAEQRTLAVHDLVVRQRQHEVLGVGVELAEREQPWW